MIQASRRQAGSLIGVLKGWLRPLLLALAVSLMLIRLDPSQMADMRITDRMLVRQAHQADPAILIVEITSGDARKYHGPPFNRRVLAGMIDRLADGEPKRVLVDMYLGSPMVPQDDAQLAAAMARLGPERLGLGTSARPDELPYALFGQHATILDTRLTPDMDGRHRRIGRTDQASGNNAARWLGTGVSSKDPVPFDLRIRPSRFERVSMDDVLTGQVKIRDRLVIVTTSSEVAPSRAFMPSMRGAHRGATFAVATQSARSGFGEAHQSAARLELLLTGMAMVLGVLCALAARSWKRMLFFSVIALALLVIAVINIAYHRASPAHPSHIISSFMIFANISMLHRLNILPMMASFLRGDVSPDEAWAWRTFENSQHPALLFTFNGQIKRSNQAGAALLAAHRDELVRLCAPRWGEPGDDVELIGEDGQRRVFQLDWPIEQIALVVMRDVTEAETAQRVLETQLMTDPLTGQANRRGFDQALVEASQSGQPYGLIYIDMNGFKAVNDSHGHDAGDELLVVVARRLGNLLRAGDTVARLGGDEFGIVAPGLATCEEALQLYQRITDAVARPITLSCIDQTVRVGAAVGYAISDGGDQPDDLIRLADQAMYQDKRQKKLRAVA